MPTETSSYEVDLDEMSENDLERGQISEGDDSRLWEAIRRETGFASYRDYLQTDATTYRIMRGVLRFVDENSEVATYNSCSIVDVLQSTDSTFEINMKDYSNGNLLATRVLREIRDPPVKSRLRIVLWWIRSSKSFRMSSRMLDTCGLGLRIAPQFFYAVGQRADSRTFAEQRDALRYDQEPYAFIGNHGMVVARDYLPGRSDAPLVLLVVGWDEEGVSELEMSPRKQFPEVLSPDFEEAPPLHRPTADTMIDCETPSILRNSDYRSRIYGRNLRRLLNDRQLVIHGDSDLLILSMLPVIHVDAFHMQGRSSALRRIHTSCGDALTENETDGHLVRRRRFDLRRHIEDSEWSQIYFADFIMSQESGNTSLDKAFQRALKLWNMVLMEGRLLDAEVRDNFHSRYTRLSIEESKKSIELASSQIEEIKRGMLFIREPTSRSS